MPKANIVAIIKCFLLQLILWGNVGQGNLLNCMEKCPAGDGLGLKRPANRGGLFNPRPSLQQGTFLCSLKDFPAQPYHTEPVVVGRSLIKLKVRVGKVR